MTFGVFVFYMLFGATMFGLGYALCHFANYYENASASQNYMDAASVVAVPIEDKLEEYQVPDATPIVNFPQEDSVVLGVAHDG